jgi:hypothetical protein
MNPLVPVNKPADSFLYSDARAETQHTSGVDQIGIGESHVPRLVGVALDAGLLA